jgi:hypothetical protein
MNMESLTASLHSGLIQRARPKVVPLREDAGPGRAAVVPLRASDIARARPAAAPLASVERPLAPRAEVVCGSRAGAFPAEPAPFRRFGLTVRVGESLREMLLESRSRTGRTTQSILHDALVDYLARIRRAQADR